MPRAKRAVIYTRVSRDDTGEGKSNQRQREDCEKLADLRGWTVVEICEDVSLSAYSGRTRPGWQRVLAMIEAGEIEVVIAWHLDRLTRSMLDLEKLIVLADEHGVGVATVTGDIDLTTDVGRMVARILAAVARAEVERKGARQKSANKQRAAEGQPWGSGWKPFGYDLTRGDRTKGVPSSLTINDTEAGMIRKAAQDVLAGASLKSIAREWRDSGVSTPRSDKGANGWTHNGVKSILLNPRNAGLNTYRGEVVGPGDWEAIFPLETHHQLVALLTDPNRLLRRTGSNGRTAENLLTGIASCGTCGSPVVAGTSNGRKVYKCKGDHITTPRSEVDAFVVDWLVQTAKLSSQETVFTLPERENVDGLTESLTALDTRQAQIAEAFAEGAIPHDAWQKANAAMNAERVELEQALAEADTGLGRDVASLHAQSIADFGTMDLAGQRAFLRERTQITLHSRQRKRNVPMSRQVSVFLRSARGRWISVVAEHPTSKPPQQETA